MIFSLLLLIEKETYTDINITTVAKSAAIINALVRRFGAVIFFFSYNISGWPETVKSE